jgi:hypothetical protein
VSRLLDEGEDVGDALVGIRGSDMVGVAPHSRFVCFVPERFSAAPVAALTLRQTHEPPGNIWRLRFSSSNLWSAQHGQSEHNQPKCSERNADNSSDLCIVHLVLIRSRNYEDTLKAALRSLFCFDALPFSSPPSAAFMRIFAFSAEEAENRQSKQSVKEFDG